MKKGLLTLIIIFINLFVAFAQSSTTLKIILYPVQIIEFNNPIENDDLEILYNGNLSTFSTSGFNVNVITPDEDNYNIEFNSHTQENPNLAMKEVSEIDSYKVVANQVLMNDFENKIISDFEENRIAVNNTPDLIYSIEAL